MHKYRKFFAPPPSSGDGGAGNKFYYWFGIQGWLLLIILITLFGGYFILVSSFFNVKRIEVEGVGKSADREKIIEIAKERLSNKKRAVLNESSLFFYSTGELEREIENNFPFEVLAIEKKFPDSILIRASEIKDAITADIFIATSTAVQTDNAVNSTNTGKLGLEEKFFGTFLLNGDGGIIRRIREDGDAASARVSVILKTEIRGERGESVFRNSDVPRYALDLYRAWQDELNIGLERIIYKDARVSEILIKTGEGWHVVFSILNSPSDQMEKLGIFLREKFPSKKNREGLLYIDLKTRDRIYWK